MNDSCKVIHPSKHCKCFHFHCNGDQLHDFCLHMREILEVDDDHMKAEISSRLTYEKKVFDSFYKNNAFI